MSRLVSLLASGLLAAALAASTGRAQTAETGFSIPDKETLDPPSAARLALIEAEAAATGWAGVILPLRSAAVRAYTHDRFVAADAWYHAYRWAALFAEPEDRFISDWVHAIVANHLNYEGVAGRYSPTDRPIGTNMSPGLQAWVLSNEAFSEEFFSNIKTVDHLPNILSILESLHRLGAEDFQRYA